MHSKTTGSVRTPRSKKSSEDEEEVLETQHSLSEEQITTVNVSHIGTEAEVQLAEALVAVSESMIGPEDAMETAHVVAVETSGQDGDEQVECTSITRKGEGWVMVVYKHVTTVRYENLDDVGFSIS